MSRWFRTYGLADVYDRLMIGAYPLDADDVEVLERLRVDRVLNLVQDKEYRRGQRAVVEAANAYVHCRAGWQRSAAVAAAVVAIRAGLDIDEALNYVQERKPSADPLP